MLTSLRRVTLPLAVLATALLIWMVNPWVQVPEGIVSQLVTVAFWVLFLVVLVLLFGYRTAPDADVVEVDGPGVTRFLFSNSRAGLFWLPIRLFLGFSWLDAGLHKVADPAWMSGGEALRGYWERAAAIPDQGRPLITFEWYRTFIQLLLDNGAEGWFAYVIVFGELAVGVGLIVGLLTGVAAFFGAFMNMSFLLAGSASTNPVLFTFAIGIMLAWRVAGYYGLDRWVLPLLGTPWRAQVGIRPQASSSA